MPSTLGSVTKHVFEYGPEAHKLHLEFVVATGQTIHKGDPVLQDTAGKLTAAGAAAPNHTMIGVAIHDAGQGEFCTVAMRGFTVVIGESAAGSQNCGPVKLGSWNGTTLRRAYAAVTGTDDAAKLALLAGHAIEPGDAAVEIKVVLF
jgi:hypothetical protein